MSDVLNFLKRLARRFKLKRCNKIFVMTTISQPFIFVFASMAQWLAHLVRICATWVRIPHTPLPILSANAAIGHSCFFLLFFLALFFSSFFFTKNLKRLNLKRQNLKRLNLKRQNLKHRKI